MGAWVRQGRTAAAPGAKAKLRNRSSAEPTSTRMKSAAGTRTLSRRREAGRGPTFVWCREPAQNMDPGAARHHTLLPLANEESTPDNLFGFAAPPRLSAALEVKMRRIFERCAGLDVHARTVVACARTPGKRGQRQREVRTFG